MEEQSNGEVWSNAPAKFPAGQLGDGWIGVTIERRGEATAAGTHGR